MIFKNHEQIFKTCFPILKGDINSGNLNKFPKYYLDGVADEADSYKLSAIVEGSKVTYDSKTGLVTKKSKSDMITISKYFIMLLLLFF